MKLKTRLLIGLIGISIMFFLALVYRSGQEANKQLTQTDTGLMCDGTKITYYVDQNGTEYVQFGDGEIEVIE